MTAPARRAAHAVLRAVHRRARDLATALDEARRPLTDARDRALAGDIALGVSRWRAALDHVIAAHASRPLDTIDDEVHDILRAATYQLLHLDRVPPHAVVADAVSLARERKKTSAAGFVNAVLRSISDRRRPVTLPLPPPPVPDDEPVDQTQALDYLSVTQSHPRWLAERWLTRYGWTAAAAWTRFNNHPAPIVVRPNLTLVTRAELDARLAADGVTTTPTRLARHGLVVTHGDVFASSAAQEGAVVVQEEGAQLVVDLASELMTTVDEGPILDLCASPGAKTVGLAGAGDPRLLVAADRRTRRVDLLRDTLDRCRLDAVAVVQLDGEAPLPFAERFSGVLVDAPCSGLGVIRRDPDIRWRRHAPQLGDYAERQTTMLDQAAPVVRAGGWLLYSTCSSEPEENEAVVEHFLAGHDAFELVRPESRPLRPLVARDGFLRTLPFRDGTDAFFAAALRRRIP